MLGMLKFIPKGCTLNKDGKVSFVLIESLIKFVKVIEDH